MARLIDADELFKKLENTLWNDNADRDIAEDLLLDATTIDPESLRPVSRLMQDKYGGIKCENCGYCVSVGGKNAYHNAKKEYQFCPHCGARMED